MPGISSVIFVRAGFVVFWRGYVLCAPTLWNFGRILGSAVLAIVCDGPDELSLSQHSFPPKTRPIAQGAFCVRAPSGHKSFCLNILNRVTPPQALPVPCASLKYKTTPQVLQKSPIIVQLGTLAELCCGDWGAMSVRPSPSPTVQMCTKCFIGFYFKTLA